MNYQLYYRELLTRLVKRDLTFDDGLSEKARLSQFLHDMMEWQMSFED